MLLSAERIFIFFFSGVGGMRDVQSLSAGGDSDLVRKAQAFVLQKETGEMSLSAVKCSPSPSGEHQ